MKTSSRITLCAALTALSLLGRAQLTQAAPQTATKMQGVSPLVASLLQKSIKTYTGFKSYQHVALYKMAQGERSSQSKFDLALQRPNKFCFKQEGRSMVTAISDGKNFTLYRGDLGEYTKKPAPATYKGINIVDDVMFQPMGTYVVALLLQGDPMADKDVKQALQKATLGKLVTEGGKQWQTVNLPFGQGPAFVFYFDVKTGLIGKATMNVEEQKFTLTETLSEVKTNQPVEASLFAFEAPKTAKLVKTFTDPQAAQEAEMKALLAKYEGKPAIDFTLKDRKGNDVSLASLKGKVVIVDFWASWCGPCKAIMPVLQEINEKYADKGVVILGVNTWDKKDDCDKFLADNTKYTFTILMDPAETNGEESVATKLYGVHGIPTTLFIDKEGVLKTYAIGSHPRDFYMDALKKLGVEVASR